LYILLDWLVESRSMLPGDSSVSDSCRQKSQMLHRNRESIGEFYTRVQLVPTYQ